MDTSEPFPGREAIHEAGHLLCIWQVGFVPTDFTLQDGGRVGGSVGWEDPRGIFDLEHLEKSMRVDVAGTAAEIVLLGSYLQGPWEYRQSETDANHFLNKLVFGLDVERYGEAITPEQEIFFQHRWLAELQQVRERFSQPAQRDQLLQLARELQQLRVLDHQGLRALRKQIRIL